MGARARKIVRISAARLLWRERLSGGNHLQGGYHQRAGREVVNRTRRFEVAEVTGSDVQVVLDTCRQIAKREATQGPRKKPADNFRKFS